MTTDHILQRIVRETTVSAVQLEKITAILRDTGGQWTATKPTQEGWYWWRTSDNAEPVPLFSASRGRDLYVSESAVETVTTIYGLGPRTGQWWSEPIKEPK